MMRSWALRVLLWATAAMAPGCGGLQVQFQVRGDAARYQTLAPGHGLSAGQQFALQVRLPSAAYVYVTRSRPGEVTQALYPLGEAVRMAAGGPQRIPTDGSDLTVPAMQPDEQLCVVIRETRVEGDLPHCPATARTQRMSERDAQAAQGGSAGAGRTDAPAKDKDAAPSSGSANKTPQDEKSPPAGSQTDGKKGDPKGESKPGIVDEKNRPTEPEKPKGEDKPGSVTKDNRPTEQGTTIVPIPLSACPLVRPDSHRRALLVGIDHYIAAPSGAPRARDLRGAYNDVRSVRSLLQRRYGFRDDEICELRDEDATRETIVGTIRSFLIERTSPGDQVFWFYAGHGSKAINPRSDEEDRLDETIVPSDANLDVPDIRDKELRHLFSQVLDRGGKLVAMFDSCHSGSITMGGSGQPARHPQDLDEDLDLRYRFAAPSRVQPPLAPSLPQPLHERGALILTATQSDQKSQERKIRGVSHGVFTAGLEDALKDQAIEPSVALLRQNIEAHMRVWARIERQTPGFAASATRQGQTLFGETAAEGHFVTVNNVYGADVQVSGGLILGLDEGTELERTTQPAMQLRVTRVLDLTTSVANITSGGDSRPAIGDLLRVRKMRSAERPILGIWLGEIGPNAAELEATRLLLQGLHQHSLFAWAEGEQNATHRLRYRAGAWEVLSAAEASPHPLGAQLTMNGLRAALTPGARLFVEWPLDQGQHEMLRHQLDAIGARALYADAQRTMADYLLQGTLNGVVQFVLEQEPAHRRHNMLTRTTPGDLISLVHAAQVLVRQHLWLTLPNPTDAHQGFPYRMRLVSLTDPQKELVSGGQSHPGEQYYLHLSRDNSIPNSANQRRFVYVCAVSSDGGMELLYPRTGGNQKNRLPVTPDGPAEIADLRGTSMFTTEGNTPSVDTYVMLTSEESIGSPAQLCSSTQQLNHGKSHLPHAHRWSVQRIEVRHQP